MAKARKNIRFAVVGLGHISQVAILPAFEHAEGAELVALVSGDREKLDVLGERHGVRQRYTYDDYDDLVRSDRIDAVYIALPNHLHRDYTVRAARGGKHVLCEKPLAPTAADCREMIAACDEAGVRLMTAYRLHFEGANMKAAELAASGRIGRPRFFVSSFSMPVKQGDIRLGPHEKGGGTLYDIGIYCINAARYLFRAEPTEVRATTATRSGDERFREVEEAASVVLRFPDERLAAFTCSFGASSTSAYRLVGTEGSFRVEPAYEYTRGLDMVLAVDGDVEKHSFAKRDQFAPEITYFAGCVREGRRPEPDGEEGLVDVMIIEAAYRSAREGRPISLEDLPARHRRPGPEQIREVPPVEPPEEIKASGPRKE